MNYPDFSLSYADIFKTDDKYTLNYDSNEYEVVPFIWAFSSEEQHFQHDEYAETYLQAVPSSHHIYLKA